MKDTWNVYEWGKNLVNDRFRLISNLLLLFIILFLGFQNVYGDFTREGFLYAYPVSILVFAFPIYLNIYWLVPRFLYKAKRKLWCYWISFLGVNLVSVLLGFIFLSPLYQRYGIRGFCIQDNHTVSFDSIAYGVLVLLLSAGGCTSFELFRRWVVSDKKILELEKATKQTELQQLKKQINPHFLYNTLESITWMIEGNKNKDAVFMISELAKIFRISLSNGKTIISIEDELKHCKNYMNIQKYRYKERFVTEYDVSEEINQFCTVKLIIQPILENAIYYGVGNMDADDNPRILVKGWRTDSDIYLAVSDNGMGMRQEDVKNILSDNKKVPKHGSGVGLINVHTRIQLMFGAKYGLIVESEPDEGTTVTIHLPAIPYTEENCELLENGVKKPGNEGDDEKI